jgi:hypothetical protein
LAPEGTDHVHELILRVVRNVVPSADSRSLVAANQKNAIRYAYLLLAGMQLQDKLDHRPPSFQKKRIGPADLLQLHKVIGRAFSRGSLESSRHMICCCYDIAMRTGRPKLAESERRSAELRIRLTGAERKQLDAAAKADAKETSTWAGIAFLALPQEEKGTSLGLSSLG